MAGHSHCLSCLLGFLTVVMAAGKSEQQGYQNIGYKSTEYKGTGTAGEDDSQLYVYPAGFKGGRYYYGGIYEGACHNDGLYYRDEDSFVICSNGNAYVQPCAPGTRSSGQHRYSPGYYYGYSDFCDINLVDQGYGPAHYAPYGVPTYKSPGYSGQDTSYNNKKPTTYGGSQYGKDAYGKYVPSKDQYATDKNAHSKDTYGASDEYSKNYAKGQAYSQQQYATRDNYNKRETAYDKRETAYEPSAK